MKIILKHHPRTKKKMRRSRRRGGGWMYDKLTSKWSSGPATPIKYSYPVFTAVKSWIRPSDTPQQKEVKDRASLMKSIYKYLNDNPRVKYGIVIAFIFVCLMATGTLASTMSVVISTITSIFNAGFALGSSLVKGFFSFVWGVTFWTAVGNFSLFIFYLLHPGPLFHLEITRWILKIFNWMYCSKNTIASDKEAGGGDEGLPPAVEGSFMMTVICTTTTTAEMIATQVMNLWYLLMKWLVYSVWKFFKWLFSSKKKGGAESLDEKKAMHAHLGFFGDLYDSIIWNLNRSMYSTESSQERNQKKYLMATVNSISTNGIHYLEINGMMEMVLLFEIKATTGTYQAFNLKTRTATGAEFSALPQIPSSDFIEAYRKEETLDDGRRILIQVVKLAGETDPFDTPENRKKMTDFIMDFDAFKKQHEQRTAEEDAFYDKVADVLVEFKGDSIPDYLRLLIMLSGSSDSWQIDGQSEE